MDFRLDVDVLVNPIKTIKHLGNVYPTKITDLILKFKVDKSNIYENKETNLIRKVEVNLK